MDKMTQRAATIAANKLLASAGYDPKGLTVKAAEKKRKARQQAGGDDPRTWSKPLKPATPIDFPEGLTKAQRKAHRQQVMVERGEAYITRLGEFITLDEQNRRRGAAIARARKAARR